MKKNVEGKRVAILATNGFEESELKSPRAALIDAGVSVDVVSLNRDAIRGWSNKNWSDFQPVDRIVSEVKAGDYDMLVIPGGMFNPDTLRTNDDALKFTRDFFKQHKPVAAICHGPWLLVEADLVKSKNVTSYPSIRTDLVNAGGNWQDRTVVVDGKLITSRNPDDIPNFIDAITQKLSS